MPLRGVIFDMGGTLLHFHPREAEPGQGWQEMENTGADALRLFLHEQGYAVPPADEARRLNFAVMLDHWRRMGEGEPVNPQLGPMLHQVMSAWGLPPAALENGLIEDAVAAYIAPVQAIIRPLEGAAETLRRLHERGLRLGLFSNTAWPGVYHLQDLARWGMMPYLECAFFSADVGIWKPRAAAFQMALEALDLQPEEAAYIGDHLYFDIYGAQQAGMRGIWLSSAEWPASHQRGLTITPDATLEKLADLPAVLEKWL